MLRNWQADCADQAIQKYTSGSNHFFCQATPGAGKTVLASEVASRLLVSNLVDLVLCFAPSRIVSDGIKGTFSQRLNCAFAGGLGSIGQSMTYQSIQYLTDEFWSTLANHRVFVVFDEIHHCSGTEQEIGNVWGQQILAKIQKLATYTLAMSGTPWRSDSLPIVMSEYSNPEGQLIVDYQYTLKQAVVEGVCRAPKIVLVDNDHLSVSDNEKTQSFSSILELLKQTRTSYQTVIHNQEAMEHLLGLGCQKLSDIRSQSPNAGGLVVAASVQHAKSIVKILTKKFGQSASIVTYLHEDPLDEIASFRNGKTQWIVSVGMISEGTDIPRLQVCCHMSSVKTELYFRQVLGRILRINSAPNQEAWLFTFAEASLIDFSERIEQDIPECRLFAKMSKDLEQNADSNIFPSKGDSIKSTEAMSELTLDWGANSTSHPLGANASPTFDELRLGQFKQRVISAFL